jgi:hypothetical protein
MKTFDFDPQLRWMFCMTHPDDEISICATIRRLVRNGNIVYLSWTHSNPVREKEARAFAKLVGVPEERLRFFGATDGSVCDEIPRLLPQFEAWMREARPDRVCCGAFEQGHIDHDATNYLVYRSHDGPIFEIPFYHTYLTRIQTLNRFSHSEGESTIELDRDEQDFKRQVAKGYPSQNIWSVVFWYEIYQIVRLRGMQLAKSERMRPQRHFDYTKPNHPPALSKVIERSSTWQRWLVAMSRVPTEAVAVAATASQMGG